MNSLCGSGLRGEAIRGWGVMKAGGGGGKILEFDLIGGTEC